MTTTFAPTAERVRQLDTAHNTKVLSLMTEGQEYKTWCYAKQGWAKVTLSNGHFLVKLPHSRKVQPMTSEQAVIAIIEASHGAAQLSSQSATQRRAA